ncbi:Hypothetical protein D9617_59g026380 [Elsinoe fawcettii]|nr:Hypothetical protein D9617_59g026380 [Elsinoe fawcettii]
MIWERIKVFLATLFSAVTAFQRKDDVVDVQLRQRAQDAASMLRNEDWVSLRREFTPLLRWILVGTALEKGFGMVKVTAGALVDVGEPSISKGWLFTTINLPVQFKRARLIMKLSMLGSGGLIGLQFVPRHVLGFGPKWQAPTYDDPSVYEERPTTLKAAGYKVEAIMTVPTKYKKYPCVVTLSGSGPCDMDSTVGRTKIMKDLPLGLARCGVASIRFEKVTFAHGVSIRNKRGFSPTDEYVPNTLAAVSHALKDPQVIKDRMYILGHSLGAYLAPKIANAQKDIRGSILLACPAKPMYRAAVKQFEYFASLDDPDGSQPHPEIVDLQRQADLADSPDLTLSTPAKNLPFGIGPAYWLDMRNYDPVEDVRFTKKRVLCLQGGRDYQVTMDDFEAFTSVFAGKQDFSHVLYEALNHLFISGKGPSTPLEYEEPGNVNLPVIRDIAGWCHGGREDIDISALLKQS